MIFGPHNHRHSCTDRLDDTGDSTDDEKRRRADPSDDDDDMFCTECGHRWEPDEIASARFCAECGAPREDLPVPTPAPVTSAAPALTSLAPSPVVPSFSPTPAPVPSNVCTQCLIPFIDLDAAFCGECGHPRPAAAPTSSSTSFVADDDGDLFGASSTTYTSAAPTPNPSASFSTLHASDLSHSSFGPPSAAVGFDPPHSTIAPPTPATSFQNYGVQPSPSYVPYSEPAPVANTADPSSPPASVKFNTMASSVNSISSLLSSLSGASHTVRRVLHGLSLQVRTDVSIDLL